MRKISILAAMFAFVAAVHVVLTRVGMLEDGTVLTPIGQRLAPWGARLSIDGRPNSLAVAPDGTMLAVANINSLDLIDLRTRATTSYLYVGANGHTGTGEAPQGLAFSPDGATIYVSTQRTMLQRFDVQKRIWKSPFAFAGLQHSSGGAPVGSLPAGLALSEDGREIYLALNAENQILALDAASGQDYRDVGVGIAPIGVVRSGKTLVVLNWGGSPPNSRQTARTSGDTEVQVAVDSRSGIAAGGSLSILSLPDLKLRRT
ncbi:MAG: YncE family protein, partial [Acidobacteriaceae bacterium]|nr:YncE family protein [Acidobacteriaceae bacterium]